MICKDLKKLSAGEKALHHGTGPDSLLRHQIHHSTAQRSAQRLLFSAFEAPGLGELGELGEAQNPRGVSSFSPFKRPFNMGYPPPNFRRQSMRKAHTRFSKSPKYAKIFKW